MYIMTACLMMKGIQWYNTLWWWINIRQRTQTTLGTCMVFTMTCNEYTKHISHNYLCKGGLLFVYSFFNEHYTLYLHLFVRVFPHGHGWPWCTLHDRISRLLGLLCPPSGPPGRGHTHWRAAWEDRMPRNNKWFSKQGLIWEKKILGGGEKKFWSA